ncbi:MAG TPA: DUF3631 domain-containing protein [Bryobacteraceae bacterium]|nr:DUF3631 domain-containing protein [Bryobacteraceae bacterium]
MAQQSEAQITDEARAILNGSVVEDVDLLLRKVEKFVRRYVVLPEATYLPIALWAIGAHAADRFDCFPYLAILSAVKRCGKTRLLEALEVLVPDPWRGTAPSLAALYRMLQKKPTLLLDEVEAFNGRNKSETTQLLLAVLNAGHRKGATIPRCEPPRHEVVHFNVYGPKLFAAIGRLPDTLTDRSILINIKRRTKAQNVARFRQVSAATEAKPLHAGIARFAGTHQAEIEQAYERTLEFDLDFLSDRDADLWTPLFAICSIMDADRLPELKRCAVTLSAAKADDDVDDSYALTLLRDIRTVWPDGEDRLETAIMLQRLKALEESPWGEPDHSLTARKLARMLRPFEVEPRNIRVGDRSPKGYYFVGLKDAFDRYLDEKCATSATSQ